MENWAFLPFTILMFENEQQAVATTTLSLILIIHKPHFLSQSRYGVEILLFIFSTRSLPPTTIIFHPTSYIFKT